MSQRRLRALIVDDEPQIRRFLRAALNAHGYDTIEASSGEDALIRAAADHPDIIILDLGLPDIDGTDVISRIREWSRIPIIVLSVRGREQDKIDALDRGADDYLTKPFSTGELMARIRAALRHQLQSEVEQPVYRSDGLVVDLALRHVSVDGKEVRLTPKEYDILRNLVVHAGRVLTHQHLLREVWGPTFTGETHYLRVYVGTLRQKIEADPARPKFIITEPGVGYRLRDQDDPEP
jgi:two-component system KDP operon response regulator KdpE